MKRECDTYRDWMALALYEELGSSESRELAAHVSSCAPCSEARRSLAAGFEHWPRASSAAGLALARDLDWLQGARARIEQATRRPRSPWKYAATGFAAGVLGAALVVSAWRSGPSRDPAHESVGETPLARSAPPPQATSPGRLRQLSLWVK